MILLRVTRKRNIVNQKNRSSLLLSVEVGPLRPYACGIIFWFVKKVKEWIFALRRYYYLMKFHAMYVNKLEISERLLYLPLCSEKLEAAWLKYECTIVDLEAVDRYFSSKFHRFNHAERNCSDPSCSLWHWWA